MAAPKGNNFWLLRSKHGRDKLFESPEIMWESACEYFQWCVDNPFEEELAFHSRGNVTKTTVKKMRPFTLEGICGHFECSTAYFRNFKSQERKEGKDFITVITRIEEVIRNQQYSGSASGFLNPNIVARYLGMSDKQEITSQQTNYNVELTPDEIKEINKQLESDC